MRFVRNAAFFSMGLFFALLALMGVGAIAEEHYLIAIQILGVLLGHSLFAVVSYLAFHFSPTAVFNFTIVNGCIAALSWDEIKHPGEVTSLFSFTKQDVCFHNKKSFGETLKLLPVCNESILLEDKIRFCLNPVSLAISLLGFIEEMVVYLVNSIPQRAASEHSYPYNASHAIYRWIKGVVSIACELIIIPLKFIEPAGNVFYNTLHLFIITLPDYFKSIVNSGDRHVEHEGGVCHGLSEHFFKRYSTKDIHKKLKEENNDL